MPTPIAANCDVMRADWVPPKLRILRDEQRLEDENGRPWQLDGYDPNRRLCTNLAWNFATWEEAIENAPYFIDECETMGHHAWREADNA